MNTSVTSGASDVSFSETDLIVTVLDGRVISIPLAWFPALLDATPEQRLNVIIGPFGEGLSWPELDEDISVQGLLAGRSDQTSRRRKITTA